MITSLARAFVCIIVVAFAQRSFAQNPSDTQAMIDDFGRWILMGAPDPRVTAINPPVASVIDIEAGRKFWAYQPFLKTSLPATATAKWSTTSIDRFVEEKLREQGLKPVSDASPEVLVRRLHFVFEPVIRAIDANTRSVYLPRVRGVLPEMLETFDAPDASLVTGSRDTTSSPLQSLFLMNSRFVQDQAVAISSRVRKQPASQRLKYVYLLTLGRLPTPSESKLVMDYFTNDEKYLLLCQALLCTVEFSSID